MYQTVVPIVNDICYQDVPLSNISPIIYEINCGQLLVYYTYDNISGMAYYSVVTIRQK